jgi:hypothetical protein
VIIFLKRQERNKVKSNDIKNDNRQHYHMDIGEIEVKIPAISEINEQFVELTKGYVKQKLVDLLTFISIEENLPRDRLMKYIHQIDFDDINSTVANSRRTNKHIDAEDQCQAKTSKGVRCTRKKRNGAYCGSHLSSRPYGEIDSYEETKIKPVIKLKVCSHD